MTWDSPREGRIQGETSVTRKQPPKLVKFINECKSPETARSLFKELKEDPAV